jgi:hypothetical protein
MMTPVRRSAGLLLCLSACAPTLAARAPGTAREETDPLDFRYASVDRESAPAPLRASEISSERLRGRTTVIVFLATYDVASQAEARFLTKVFREHTPRINAAAILLDPPENGPLLAAFGDALHLPYPLAIADRELLAGRGPFGDAHAVPTTVILDELGRMRWKHIGLAKDTEIEQGLAEATR